MPEKIIVKLRVNGAEHQVACKPYDVLLDVIREQLDLTGTKRGCDMGTCGCCTVLVGERPVLSCLTLALEAEEQDITTIEGLRCGSSLHPLQRAFAEHGGSQCGFCTPGFIMTSVALLKAKSCPSRDEIKQAVSGNQCRCTGYQKIFESIEAASREIAGDGSEGGPR